MHWKYMGNKTQRKVLVFYKQYICRMSWRSKRLFVCNINFNGEDVIRILVEFFQIFDQTTGGKCSCFKYFHRKSVQKKIFFKELFSHKIRWLRNSSRILIKILVGNFSGKCIRWLWNFLRILTKILTNEVWGHHDLDYKVLHKQKMK